MRVAAIDIGTNTILLLVAEVEAVGRITPLWQEQRITRLGRGVDRTRRLSPQAMAESFAVLEEYVKISHRLGAEKILAVGTSALREAKNRGQFTERVEQQLGLPIKVVSGEEEAQLTLLGALSNKRHLEGNVLVVDIGGGSTEFILGRGDEILGLQSVEMGSVRLTERWVHHDPITDEEYEELVGSVRQQLKRVDPLFRKEISYLVGVAGTVTTLAAMDQRMTVYDGEKIDGSGLELSALEKIIGELKRRTLAERMQMPGLEPRRADVILAGAVLLSETMHGFGSSRVIVSDRGVRFGIAVRAACAG